MCAKRIGVILIARNQTLYEPRKADDGNPDPKKINVS